MNSRWLGFFPKDESSFNLFDGVNNVEHPMETLRHLFVYTPASLPLAACGIDFRGKGHVPLKGNAVLVDLGRESVFAGPNKVVRAFLIGQARSNQVKADPRPQGTYLGGGGAGAVNTYPRNVDHGIDVLYSLPIGNCVVKFLSVARLAPAFRLEFAVIPKKDYPRVMRAIRDGKRVKSYIMELGVKRRHMPPVGELEKCVNALSETENLGEMTSPLRTKYRVGSVANELAALLFEDGAHSLMTVRRGVRSFAIFDVVRGI